MVSHHRGAYFLAQGNALTTSMRKHAVDLWMLPHASLKRLADMKTAGFDVIHLCGLTETYGPAVIDDWHDSRFSCQARN